MQSPGALTPTSAMKRRLAWLGAWILATALLVVCARTVDWTRALEVLSTAHVVWLGFAVLLNGVILVCWAAFWRALRPDDEAPASYGRMFEIVATASSLMNTVPFGGGHASSIVLLMRRGSMTQGGALSVLALDQLGEGITKVSLFVLVAALLPLPTWMRAGVTTASLVVAAWFITLMVASRWARGLGILKHWRRSIAALACVIAMKGVEALALAAVQHAFGLSLSPGGTLLVLAALILGTMLPVAPANLGTYEASVFLAYRYLGVSPEQALTLAVVEHVCFLLPSVGVGYAFISAHTLSRSAIASR
jgi:glycosyltransferase 2 family protein